MLANLILSGGGVRSYAHLGVYKYCFENKIKFGEIDLDIYIPYYSKLTLPIEDIKNETTKIY